MSRKLTNEDSSIYKERRGRETGRGVFVITHICSAITCDTPIDLDRGTCHGSENVNQTRRCKDRMSELLHQSQLL